MASLWIRPGYDLKVEMSAKTYKNGLSSKLSQLRAFSHPWILGTLKSGSILSAFKYVFPITLLAIYIQGVPEEASPSD